MVDTTQGASSTQPETTIRAAVEGAQTNATRQSPAASKRSWSSILIVLVVGLVVFHPTLRSPFLLDDYLQAAMVDGTFPCKRGIFDLYDFVNEPDRTVLADRGMITWWSDPHLQIRFFRPLASALRWAEHLALGRNSFLLHLHSFCWWFVAVLGARSLFLYAFSRRAAAIATFIFALAPGHVMPLAWLANREVFMTLAFGTFALRAYVQFRDTRRVAYAFLAFVLFGLALFSGEYGLCLAGFVVAAELGWRYEGAFRRLTGLMPFIGPTLAYMAVRAWLGYGSHGSGYYTDPLDAPLRFLSLAPQRFIMLLAHAWMSLDYDSLDVGTSIWLLLALTIVGGSLLVITFRWLFRQLEVGQRRWFWTFAIGSLVALVPVMAVSPTPRVVGASMIGVAGLVAMLLERSWFVVEQGPRDRSLAAQISAMMAILLGFAHLVHGPGAAALSSERMREHGLEFVQHAESLRSRLVSSDKLDVVVLRASINAFYMPFILDPEGRLPVRWRILSQTKHTLVMRRGTRTLELIARPDERLYSLGRDHLFRDDPTTIRVGDVLHMPGVKVTILAVGTAGPRIARYEFDEDLDSSRLTWLVENNEGFAIERPPLIGFGKPYDL